MNNISYSIISYKNISNDIKNNIISTIISDSTFDYLINEENHNEEINDNIIKLINNNNIYYIRLLSKSGSTFTEILKNYNDKLIDIKKNINNYYYIPLENSMKLKNDCDDLAGILQYNKFKHLAIQLPTIYSYNNEFKNYYNKELYSRYEIDECNQLELDHYHMCNEGILFVLNKYLTFINIPNAVIISIGWNSFCDYNLNDLNEELNNIVNYIKN